MLKPAFVNIFHEGSGSKIYRSLMENSLERTHAKTIKYKMISDHENNEDKALGIHLVISKRRRIIIQF